MIESSSPVAKLSPEQWSRTLGGAKDAAGAMAETDVTFYRSGGPQRKGGRTAGGGEWSDRLAGRAPFEMMMNTPAGQQYLQRFMGSLNASAPAPESRDQGAA